MELGAQTGDFLMQKGQSPAGTELPGVLTNGTDAQVPPLERVTQRVQELQALQ